MGFLVENFMKKKLPKTNFEIWYLLKKNRSIDHLINNEDISYINWCHDIIRMITGMYTITETLIKYKCLEINFDLSKKEVREKIKSIDKSLQPIILGIYKNKDVSKLIWKKIKPTEIYTYGEEN